MILINRSQTLENMCKNIFFKDTIKKQKTHDQANKIMDLLKMKFAKDLEKDPVDVLVREI